jgi:pyruvate/2-oxoglutarate dehydrogenase complex dihydrolipoamide acyltransferase (E2) component
MRRGIAEHMRRSLDTAAHVTSAIEVDMSRVVAIRNQLKAQFRESYGVNLTYLAFISRATVETLREWPYINAEIRGEAIVTHGYVNLGFAVALDGGKGLIVPASERRDAQPARWRGFPPRRACLHEKLLPDDVQGGTSRFMNPQPRHLPSARCGFAPAAERHPGTYAVVSGWSRRCGNYVTRSA